MTLRCKTPFVTVDKKGRKVRCNLGTLVKDGDPLVKGREAFFEDVDEVVEETTANPGHLRTAKRPNDDAKPQGSE